MRRSLWRHCNVISDVDGDIFVGKVCEFMTTLSVMFLIIIYLVCHREQCLINYWWFLSKQLCNFSTYNYNDNSVFQTIQLYRNSVGILHLSQNGRTNNLFSNSLVNVLYCFGCVLYSQQTHMQPQFIFRCQNLYNTTLLVNNDVCVWLSRQPTTKSNVMMTSSNGRIE